MTNISIKVRLYILSGFFAVILVIIAIISSYTINKNYKIGHSKNMAQQLNIHLLNLRKQEKDFLMRDVKNATFQETGKSTYLEMFESEYKAAMNHIKSLIAENHYIDAGIEKEVIETKAIYESYYQQFYKLIEAYKVRGFKDVGIIGKMREAIDMLENSLEASGENDKNTIHFLRLRRYEIDYNLYKLDKFIDKFSNEVVLMQDDIKKLSISNGQKNEVLNAISIYHKVFNDLVGQDKIIGNKEDEGLYGELGVKANKLEPLVIKIIDALNSYAEQEARNNINFMFIIIILGIILNLIISFRIIKSIYSLLGGEPKLVAEIADKISAGNLKLNLDASKFSQGIMKSMYSMAEKLVTIVGNITKHANDISIAANQLSNGINQISHGASEQASSVEEVSSTMEEIASNIEQNKDNAQSTQKIAQTAYRE